MSSPRPPEFKQVSSENRVQTSVKRVFPGPDVGGCRPVVVTFEEFTDREQVGGYLRKIIRRLEQIKAGIFLKLFWAQKLTF